jgi:hypothetical protein
MTVRVSAILLLLTLGVVTAQTNSVPARKDNSVCAELAKATLPRTSGNRTSPVNWVGSETRKPPFL